MRNKYIGIDLTSAVAHMECGMVIALKRIISALPCKKNDINFILFCTEKNINMYDNLKNIKIEVLTTDIEYYHNNINFIDVLHSPFNKVDRKIDGALSLLTKYDLIPPRFINDFREDQIVNSIESCHEADYILTSTEFSKRDIHWQTDIDENKIEAVYLPVEKSILGVNKPNVDLSKPFLCYPAAGRAHKNHENLFKAFSKIKSDVNLVLTTGEKNVANNKFNYLEKLTAEYHLTGRVHVLGCLTEEELNYIYSHALALVYPSLSEGFGLPLVEAMTFYRPILCSYWSCMPEIVGDIGIYFNPKDPDCIARTIDDFLNSEYIVNVGSYDRQLEKFKKNKIGEEMIQFYSQLVYKSKILNLRKKRNNEIKGMLAIKHIMIEKELYSKELLSYTEEFVLLMDCSRLLGTNNVSGISKYIFKLFDVLSSKLGSRFIPFYDENARGLAKDLDIRTRFVLNNDKEYNLYHKGYAINLAKSISKNIVYFSPYHPLPKLRDKDFSYVITIFDIFHLTRLDIYPEQNKYFTNDIVKSILKNDEVVCISKHTATELIKYQGYKHHVSVSFLLSMNDMIEEKKYKKKNLPQILIPFQNDPRKNFRLMLESYYEYLKIGGVNSKLCIFGKTNLLSEDDKKLINEINKHVNVKLVLTPSDIDLAKLILDSSCFLYLSELEGFGLPPLEAMVGGCASIVLDNTALSEVYDGWPFKLSSNSSSIEVAANIKKLLHSDENYIVKEIEKVISKYTVENFLNSHLSAFYEAMRRKNGN
ncbi:glycosyltransferase involved in cell wall biosynthesis [Allofrancisella inopinata]|uniref:Glycosyltransferase n=1 Tax=Allofrancisella inopinata TaxID=1085647 RepID=A0AAE6YIC7_9GAMM|nr:glycosyltransferase [Allofrancisella inopinata]QIV96505.1 glycosyltransferase [Allofrancisella inopinata]TDT68501.1 glycosyltransferase involved in cell wall biosynthesis [Allofrancisella inopinata]